MKKLIQVSKYALASLLVLILSQTPVFAESAETQTSGLSSAQVVGGVSILLLAILIPTIRKERKSTN